MPHPPRQAHGAGPGRASEHLAIERARTDGIISPVSAQLVGLKSQNELEECETQSRSLILKRRSE